MNCFYVLKQGVYDQGVFWIGTDINDAIKRCKELAASDVDDYHTWNVVYHENATDEVDCSGNVINQGQICMVTDKSGKVKYYSAKGNEIDLGELSRQVAKNMAANIPGLKQ